LQRNPVSGLKADLESKQSSSLEDRELIMRLSPLFDRQLESAKLSGLQQGIQQGVEQGLQQGIQQGVEQGLQQGERLVVENLLRFRFGAVDPELTLIIDSLLSLPPAEFTPLLMQLSREELIDRFRSND
jgi:flagellar biosynthesis/type III secretory pathway protein FliH